MATADRQWSSEFKSFNHVTPKPFLSQRTQNYVNHNRPLQQQQIANWDEQFDTYAKQSNQTSQPPLDNSIVNDDLARTADNLIKTVQPQRIDKFSQSQFFSLMNKLASRETVLEDDRFVTKDDASNWSNAFLEQVNQTPHTASTHTHAIHPSSISNAPSPYNKLFGLFSPPSPTPATTSATQDGVNQQDGDLEQGGGTAAGVRGPQDLEWENFLSALDELDEHTPHSPPSSYKFNSSSIQNTSNYINLAEKDVKQQPYNAEYWYQLGVSQQENESELQAIPALLKAVEMNPQFEDAWLALSISYTNESNKTAAIDAIYNWMLVKQSTNTEMGPLSRDLNEMARILCEMVRDSTEDNKLQSDLQVALGVIFTLAEEYEKSVDCFSTAVSVNPNDWLLLNRLGATLSNSGQCQAALEYYYRALTLHPTYVRAKFNLGIALMNLKVRTETLAQDFEEAIRQLLSAVSIQCDGVQNDSSNQFNDNMWDTVKNCLLQ
ncbi:hypothetical protein E3P99_01200 [Wallemia hederae]|uniref:Peroxin-5 n=1 Tax=Wallemia hederae TaxID=1540922 RepID=A0A4T0FRY4_9BASI|nr:hypothetical protein E3P99_01200 [Wallemia hederae]